MFFFYLAFATFFALAALGLLLQSFREEDRPWLLRPVVALLALDALGFAIFTLGDGLCHDCPTTSPVAYAGGWIIAAVVPALFAASVLFALFRALVRRRARGAAEPPFAS